MDSFEVQQLIVEVRRVADALERIGDATDIKAILAMQRDMQYVPGDPSQSRKIRSGQMALESLARVLVDRVNRWFGEHS